MERKSIVTGREKRSKREEGERERERETEIKVEGRTREARTHARTNVRHRRTQQPGARPRATKARAALTLSTERSLRRGPRLDMREIGVREDSAHTAERN